MNQWMPVFNGTPMSEMPPSEACELIIRTKTAPDDGVEVFLTNLRVRGWMDFEMLSQHRKNLIMVKLLLERNS